MSTFIEHWSIVIIPVFAFAVIVSLWYILWKIGWNAYNRWVRKTGWVQSHVISHVAKWPSFFWGVLLGVAVSLTVSDLPRLEITGMRYSMECTGCLYYVDYRTGEQCAAGLLSHKVEN